MRACPAAQRDLPQSHRRLPLPMGRPHLCRRSIRHRNRAAARTFRSQRPPLRPCRPPYPRSTVIRGEQLLNACLLAAEHAPTIGFRRYIVSATTPFAPSDLLDLRVDASRVVRRLVPEFEGEYASHGWKMVPSIDRVYVNELARNELGWQPRYDFKFLIDRLRAGESIRSPLARLIGSKAYHAEET